MATLPGKTISRYYNSKTIEIEKLSICCTAEINRSVASKMVISKQGKAEKLMHIILFKVYFLVLQTNSVSSKQHRNKGRKKDQSNT